MSTRKCVKKILEITDFNKTVLYVSLQTEFFSIFATQISWTSDVKMKAKKKINLKIQKSNYSFIEWFENKVYASKSRTKAHIRAVSSQKVSKSSIK